MVQACVGRARSSFERTSYIRLRSARYPPEAATRFPPGVLGKFDGI